VCARTGTCAWAALLIAGRGWVNATVSLQANKMVLTADSGGAHAAEHSSLIL
jgi:hypothetical protein